MKKVFLVCVAVIALVGVDIDSAAIEQEYQRLLLGQWQLLGIDMILNTDLGQEEKHVLNPIVSWRFEDDGCYYETVCYQGDTVIRQYGYVLRNDSIMLQVSSNHEISSWYMIDTLTRDRLVLTSAHPIKDGELMWVYRFQRDKASFAQSLLPASGAYSVLLDDSDMVNYRYVGSVLSKRDTIKLVLATSFFNNRVSSRCNARLGVYLDDSLYGYYTLGGDYYDFCVEDNILYCIKKDDLSNVTKIELHDGIASKVFIQDTVDEKGNVWGDYFYMDEYAKTGDEWLFPLVWIEYKFR
jgi:hypothetical protein